MCFNAPTYRCYLICNVILLGPLANVFVEGPIEEIAGPWALASNPNAPYDSHVVVPADPNVPLLRQLYFGDLFYSIIIEPLLLATPALGARRRLGLGW